MYTLPTHVCTHFNSYTCASDFEFVDVYLEVLEIFNPIHLNIKHRFIESSTKYSLNTSLEKQGTRFV